jgi:hypothetical protein
MFMVRAHCATGAQRGNVVRDGTIAALNARIGIFN